MLEFINFFTEIIKKYVDLLFNLPIYESVSVGSFILGCIVFTIVIGYLLGRFTISLSDSESLGTKTRQGRDEKRREATADFFKNYKG